MANRVTAKNVERVAEIVSGMLWKLDIMAADEVLVIESGSATYGRAWKVFVTGGQYGSAWHTPPFGALYSSSAKELHGKLVAVLNTLEAVQTVAVSA